jgi:hypothetical protein
VVKWCGYSDPWNTIISDLKFQKAENEDCHPIWDHSHIGILERNPHHPSMRSHFAELCWKPFSFYSFWEHHLSSFKLNNSIADNKTPTLSTHSGYCSCFSAVSVKCIPELFCQPILCVAPSSSFRENSCASTPHPTPRAHLGQQAQLSKPRLNPSGRNVRDTVTVSW